MRQEDSKPPVDIGRIVVCSPDATEETLKAHGFPGVCADGQEKIKASAPKYPPPSPNRTWYPGTNA